MGRLVRILLGLLLMALSVLLGTGCIHLRRPHDPNDPRASAAPLTPECRKLESKVIALNLSSILSGGLGTIAAAGAGIFDQPLAARASLSGGAAAFSLVGAVTSYLATASAARFSRDCATP